jgi:phosphinothricin acetyltransferase
LHERVGFQVVGVYRRHGKIDGVWRDCVIVEKLLGDAAEATLERNASSSTGSFA